MAFNTSDKTDRKSVPETENEFYVRAIAAWILLLLPGLLLALVFGQWLLYLVVLPIIISPCTIWVYDLTQRFKQLNKQTKKFLLLTLSGFSLSILLAAILTQSYAKLPNFFSSSSAAEYPIASSEYVEENSSEVHSLFRSRSALDRAKELGRQASDIVQSPPHPLSTWELAYQKWTQAIQSLESIPPGTETYAEADAKLADYQANRRMIAERIETEKKAIDSYENAKRIVSELADSARSIESYKEIDILTLQQINKELEIAVQSFQSIPSGTVTFEQAQANIDLHRYSFQIIQSMLEMLRGCQERTSACNVDESLWMSLVRNF